MSWGHDEYIYHVVKDRLPEEALYMLRYHSFYPWHKEKALPHLTNETDRAMLKWVRAFNRYDLYSKGAPRPDVPALMPYYQELVEEFFPTRFAGRGVGARGSGLGRAFRSQSRDGALKALPESRALEPRIYLSQTGGQLCNRHTQLGSTHL